jgi:outer membrane protein OmpA-like peptidoglycan-associated protein
MKNGSFQIRAFAAASVLGMVCVAAITDARAEEIASSVHREPSKPPVSVENLETYTLVKLNRVYFNYEATDLRPEEKIILNAVVKCFSGTAQSVIELRGYTDAMESAQRGPALGARRSHAIAQYLTANGVPSDSILLVALDGMSDEDKSMNPEHRRVDIRVFSGTASGEREAHPTLHGRPPAAASTGTNRVHQLAVSKPQRGV